MPIKNKTKTLTLTLIILVLTTITTPTTQAKTTTQPPIKTLWEKDIPAPAIVYSVDWSPDGERIAAGTGWPGKLIVFDRNGNKLWESEDLGGSVNSVSWSPDGLLLGVGGSFSRELKVFYMGYGVFRIVGGVGARVCFLDENGVTDCYYVNASPQFIYATPGTYRVVIKPKPSENTLGNVEQYSIEKTLYVGAGEIREVEVDWSKIFGVFSLSGCASTCVVEWSGGGRGVRDGFYYVVPGTYTVTASPPNAFLSGFTETVSVAAGEEVRVTVSYGLTHAAIAGIIGFLGVSVFSIGWYVTRPRLVVGVEPEELVRGVTRVVKIKLLNGGRRGFKGRIVVEVGGVNVFDDVVVVSGGGVKVIEVPVDWDKVGVE